MMFNVNCLYLVFQVGPFVACDYTCKRANAGRMTIIYCLNYIAIYDVKSGSSSSTSVAILPSRRTISDQSEVSAMVQGLG